MTGTSRIPTAIMLITFLCAGCVWTNDVSMEAPYDAIIGDSYLVQDVMGIYKSACWEIGGLVLTPDGDYSDCFKGDAVAKLRRGDKFFIKRVVLKRNGVDGICPQVVVGMPNVRVDDEVFIPLCSSRKSISWLDSDKYSFNMGDPIVIKEQYALKVSK